MDAALAKMIDDLQHKWDALSDAAKTIEAAGGEASVALNHIVADCQLNSVDAWVRVGKLTDVFDRFSPGDAMRDVPDEYYPQVIAKVRDYMDTLRAKVGAEVRTAQDNLDAAHGVFRKDTTATALDRGGLKAMLGR